MMMGVVKVLIMMMTMVAIGIVPPAVRSMQWFEVSSGSSKCIMEHIKKNAMTIGKFAVVNPTPGFPMPENHKITIRVTSARGTSYYTAEQVESGTFAFTAYEGGDYTACFWVRHRKPPHMITIEFDWKSGIDAKGWAKVATKGQLEAMEIELMNMYDRVVLIHDEMFNLREREEEMQALNRATNSKMATFSFLSILVCLSVAALQIWHLKTFFERKKLL